jgi:hypothetical protein
MNIPQTLNIPVHSDPGHAWGVVKRELLTALGILDQVSACSYQRGGMVYLEEDCDLSLVVRALQDRGCRVTCSDHGNGEASWVRSLPRFSPTLAPLPADAWLVFIRTVDGPTLVARNGFCPLHYGATITSEYLMNREEAHHAASNRAALSYRPIRANSKRAHDLLNARGYTYSQPVRQAAF